MYKHISIKAIFLNVILFHKHGKGEKQLSLPVNENE